MNFTIAKCSGNHASTDLEPWEIDSKSLVNSSNELITPVIGNKDGSYFYAVMALTEATLVLMT